jgi:hypothetical protein
MDSKRREGALASVGEVFEEELDAPAFGGSLSDDILVY